MNLNTCDLNIHCIADYMAEKGIGTGQIQVRKTRFKIFYYTYSSGLNGDIIYLQKSRHTFTRCVKERSYIVDYQNLNTTPTQICKTYSVEDIASILGVSKSSAYELCKKGLFQTLRIGRIIRINRESFDKWFRSGQ